MNEVNVTTEDMKTEIRREMAQRRGVYSKWIRNGTWTQDDSDRHIGRLAAIIDLIEEVECARNVLPPLSRVRKVSV